MSQESVEVVRRWWAGFNAHGMPALDHCDQQIEIEMLADFPVQGPFRGHAGVRRYVAQIFEVTEDPRVEISEIIDPDDGETIVTVQRVLGRASHTRLKIEYQWAAIWTIQAGKVARVHGYATKAEALEAVGLSE